MYLIDIYRSLRSLILVPLGIPYFLIMRKTPIKCFYAMIWMFCFSRGYLIDFFSFCIKLTNGKSTFDYRTGILANFQNKKINRDLQENGFVVFPSVISRQVCQNIISKIQLKKTLPRLMDNEVGMRKRQVEVFDSEKLSAVFYEYSTDDILEIDEIQDLIFDESILQIVQEYLGSNPIIDILALWWSTNYNTTPDKIAAQNFHFDLDRFKWLKVFVYLTDVESNNGAHEFVKGSHKSGAIPFEILRKGYVRLTDEEVIKTFGDDKTIKLSAPAGSIIIEDTRGLHKGNLVTGNPRLMLSIQYSNSLYGCNVAPKKIPSIKTYKFTKMFAKNKLLFNGFIGNE